MNNLRDHIESDLATVKNPATTEMLKLSLAFLNLSEGKAQTHNSRTGSFASLGDIFKAAGVDL